MSTYACTSTLNKTFLLFEHNCLSAYACSAFKKMLLELELAARAEFVCFIFHSLQILQLLQCGALVDAHFLAIDSSRYH